MKKSFLPLLLVFSLFLVSGCVITIGKKKPLTAGVYKSFNKGDRWQTKGRVVLSGGLGSLQSINVIKMIPDPQDNNAFYLISEAEGLFYTYDGGENWFQPPQLSSGKINDLVVDPQNKCVIYAAYGNRILKSVDCSRSWQEIYLDTRPQNLTALAVDSSESLAVYAGTESGEILKSSNGGVSWATIKRFGSPIRKILAHSASGKVFYVATQSKGLYETNDGGKIWEDLNEGLKKFSGYNEYYDLIINEGNPDNLFLICHYGPIKTVDGGKTWEALNLITPPLSTKIYAFAVNPQNSQELYYATASTFYKTINGGQNWITKRLPGTTAASALLVDPVNPSILYLGMRNLKK